MIIIIGRIRTCASVCPATVNLPHSVFYDIITPWALRYDNDYYYYVYSDLGALRVRRMNSWKWLRFIFLFLLSAARENTPSADKSGALILMDLIARPAAHEFIRRAGCTFSVIFFFLVNYMRKLCGCNICASWTLSPLCSKLRRSLPQCDSNVNDRTRIT